MRYVALLRGVFPVNAPNTKLVALFNGLAFSDIQTIGSSGNVLFTTNETNIMELEKKIEQALYDLLGTNAVAIVRSAEQIKSLVESVPFGEHKHTSATYLAVTFFKHKPVDTTSDTNAIYYEQSANALCTVNDSTAKPHFMTRLEREYGRDNTTRTWNVVLKIVAKLSM